MEEGSMLGANSVLATGQRVPSGELWAGNPARKIRDLTGDESGAVKDGALRYWKIANEHLDEFYLPIGTQYIEAQKIDEEIGHRVWDEVDATPKPL
jgi:carbonic anhydrase/acetyltransferase-like protein (isoleucine patch superfamily)